MPVAPIRPPAQAPISHVLIYTGPTNAPQINLLRAQLAFLNQPAQQNAQHLPATGLLLVLSSWGGQTFEARSLYGLIRSLPFPTEIHAAGTIQSAAIPLMMAADRRTCTPDTTFLFHPWVWSTDPDPGRSMDELQQFPMRIEDDVDWAKDVLDQHSGLKHPEIERLQLFTSASIEDSGFALKYGLVHDVLERKIPHGVMTWNIA